MIERCYNKDCKSYKYYGKRGIKVSKKWRSSSTGLLEFAKWMKLNNWQSGLQVDRIDNNKGYSPNNCRLVTSKINNNNKRNTNYIVYNNKMYSAKMFIEKYSNIKITVRALMKKIDKGQDCMEAVTKSSKFIITYKGRDYEIKDFWNKYSRNKINYEKFYYKYYNLVKRKRIKLSDLEIINLVNEL